MFWAQPPAQEPSVYIANHSSHLDFVVLWASLPVEVRRRTRPVAALDYWQGGIRRFVADRVFHALLIERHSAKAVAATAAVAHPGAGNDPADDVEIAVSASPVSGALRVRGEKARQAIARMIEVLDQGSSLILFPEGSRDGSGSAPFRSGLYYLCSSRPAIPVVPVYLENLNRIMPKGALLPVPLLSRVIIGQPFHIEKDESRREYLARAQTKVMELHPWL